jgi:hypothetical protein
MSLEWWGKRLSIAVNGCWNWIGDTDDGGYGVVTYHGKGWKAHRLSWLYHNGSIPDAPLCVLHTCDNPPCCNPAHLFLGTKPQNNSDCKAKGRLAVGENSSNAKLTAAAVLSIRQQWANQSKTVRQLANENAVTVVTIRSVLKREYWKHI